ncbi:MAG TPA: ATP-binding protein [Alphaproteobacteria bacterium]|nr:ATP-binding protein [Alphaproteobacteria bacterium]
MKAGRIFRTSTFRLTLLYLAPFGILVFVLFAVLYWATLGLIDSQTNATIEAEVRGLAEQYGAHGLDRLVQVVAERSGPNGEKGAVYLLTGPDLHPLAGNLDAWPETRNTVSRDGWINFEIDRSSGGNATTRQIRAKVFRIEGGFRLLVGRDMAERAAFRAVIAKTLTIALGIAMALGVAGALYLSRMLLARVEAVAETSRTIVRGDLAGRVPLQGSGDEFDRLSTSLNEMLDQIEHLMTGMRAVTDSLAHDLRSPLTRLKGRIENALRSQPDGPHYRETLERANADVDAILATFNALLSISQAEAGAARSSMSRVNLGSIAQDAFDLYEPLADEKGLTLKPEIEADTFIIGHAQLLAQSVANLLDNAIKCTPQGGTITLTVRRGRDRSALVIADTGPGIPASERQHVLERFVRLDASRSSPGSGLGLSLVAAVAQLHRAALRLEDNNPGLRVTLEFEATAGEDEIKPQAVP